MSLFHRKSLNSFTAMAGGDFLCLLVTVANSLDPDQVLSALILIQTVNLML